MDIISLKCRLLKDLVARGWYTTAKGYLTAIFITELGPYYCQNL